MTTEAFKVKIESRLSRLQFPIPIHSLSSLIRDDSVRRKRPQHPRDRLVWEPNLAVQRLLKSALTEPGRKC